MNKFLILGDDSEPVSSDAGPVAAPSPRGGARPGAGRKKNVKLGDAYARFNEARAKKEQHNAKLAEFEELERAGELVRADAVRAEWQDIFTRVRARLLSMPSKLAAQAHAGKTVAEVEGVLTAGIHEALQELARDE